MNVDSLSAVQLLQNLKSLVIFGSPSGSTVFKAQDSLTKLNESELVKIQLDFLEDVPQLLYSEDISKAMREINVELPYGEVLGARTKTKVLIGVRLDNKQ